MTPAFIVLNLLFGAIVIANVFVSYRVLKSDYFEKRQKYIQCLLIWFVPIAGAWIAYMFARESSGPTPRASHLNDAPYHDADIGLNQAGEDFLGGGHHDI